MIGISQTLAGPYPSKVDTLTFTLRRRENLSPGDVPALGDLRLFSTGGGSELLEWDLSKGCVRVSTLGIYAPKTGDNNTLAKRTINSKGGAIWSVSVNPRSTILALGCEDGSIQLLSTESDGLSHLRKLGKVKSRLLSIAWGPPVPRDGCPPAEITTGSDDSSDDEDDADWADVWLVTGCADSSIRKWDFATGRVTNRLTTDKTRAERTLVWSVCVLGYIVHIFHGFIKLTLDSHSDGTIVSGDSMGIVKFWDSKTCTQLSTFQAHGADVLCLSVSPVSHLASRFDIGLNCEVTRKGTRFILPASTRRSFNSPMSPGQWPHQNLTGFRHPLAVYTHMTSVRWRFGLPSRPSPSLTAPSSPST